MVKRNWLKQKVLKKVVNEMYKNYYHEYKSQFLQKEIVRIYAVNWIWCWVWGTVTNRKYIFEGGWILFMFCWYCDTEHFARFMLPRNGMVYNQEASVGQKNNLIPRVELLEYNNWNKQFHISNKRQPSEMSDVIGTFAYLISLKIFISCVYIWNILYL